MHLRTRLQVGRTLGWLTDPRFPVQTRASVRFVEPTLVRVPTGRYRVGQEWTDHYGDELPARIVDHSTFLIGKWPVTNAEYSCFIEAGGYRDERWWRSDVAQRWLGGEEVAGGPMTVWLQNWRYAQEHTRWREDLAKTGEYSPQELKVLGRIATLNEEDARRYLTSAVATRSRERPAFWESRSFSNPAQPVVGVTLFEAEAYCAWLSVAAAQAYQLPSSVEWEVAAGGSWAHKYPWGNDWTAERANTIEGRVQLPSPVGAYAASGGIGPFAAEDQSGNVWEWTRSLYERAPGNRVDQYATSGEQCVRGGSWDSSHKSASCAHTERYAPAFYSDSLGFRVASSNGVPTVQWH